MTLSRITAASLLATLAIAFCGCRLASGQVPYDPRTGGRVCVPSGCRILPGRRVIVNPQSRPAPQRQVRPQPRPQVQPRIRPLEQATPQQSPASRPEPQRQPEPRPQPEPDPSAADPDPPDPQPAEDAPAESAEDPEPADGFRGNGSAAGDRLAIGEGREPVWEDGIPVGASTPIRPPDGVPRPVDSATDQDAAPRAEAQEEDAGGWGWFGLADTTIAALAASGTVTFPLWAVLAWRGYRAVRQSRAGRRGSAEEPGFPGDHDA